MIFYPAIDLKDGNCVRLLRGEMNAATIFSKRPAAQAQSFSEAGCSWIHIVDLNGAFAGRPVNAKAVESIVSCVDVPIQLGGGIRDMDTVDFWLSSGVERVILGTAALSDPKLVQAACKKYPGQVALGIDARKGFVAINGWSETTRTEARELAEQFDDLALAAIIYTDINRDGAMFGPNIESIVSLAGHIKTPIIASGGVSCISDLVELKKYENIGVGGVICGRAIYDRKINIPDALELMAN